MYALPTSEPAIQLYLNILVFVITGTMHLKSRSVEVKKIKIL